MWAAGASGYVLKDEPLERILAAVRAAGRGEPRFWPEQVERALRWWEETGRKWESLTEREREVLVRMAEGRSNREIAADLWISEKTVEAHIGRVLQKLGLTSRTEAALWAVQNGWWKNSGMEKSGISLIDSALLNGL